MNAVADAQRVVDSLGAKKLEAEKREAEACEERQTLAFAAYTGNTGARKRLEELNAQLVVLTGEIASISAAIVEAEQRLSQSKQLEDEKAKQDRTRRLVEHARNLRASASELDAAARALAKEYAAFQKDAAVLRALGLARLNSDLVSSATRRALHAHLQGTGLTLERLAPNQRHTFGWLVENWTAGIAVAADSTAPAVPGNKVACSKERPKCPT